MTEWIAAGVPVVLGWIGFTERRISEMKGDIKAANAKLDLLVQYLIPEAEAKSLREARRDIDRQGG